MNSKYSRPSNIDSANTSYERGFTLIELLVAIVVGALVIGTIVAFFSTITTSQRNVWYTDVATRAARSEIESARAKGVSALTAGDTNIKSRLPASLPADATGVLNIGATSFGSSRLVTVTITWDSGKKKVVLTGTVGQQGLIP